MTLCASLIGKDFHHIMLEYMYLHQVDKQKSCQGRSVKLPPPSHTQAHGLNLYMYVQLIFSKHPPHSYTFIYDCNVLVLMIEGNRGISICLLQLNSIKVSSSRTRVYWQKELRTFDLVDTLCPFKTCDPNHNLSYLFLITTQNTSFQSMSLFIIYIVSFVCISKNSCSTFSLV